jgi:cell division protein FtsB
MLLEKRASKIKIDNYKKQRRATRRSLFFVIILTLLVAVLVGIMLVRYAKINEVKYLNFELKKELSDLKVLESEIVSKISENVDLNVVEEYAINQLGMVYPQNNQKYKILKTKYFTLGGEVATEPSDMNVALND